MSALLSGKFFHQLPLVTLPTSGCWEPQNGVPFLSQRHLAVVVKTVMGSHFGGLVNSPPILNEPILVVGLVDIHWG